jgi:hypothetical protein
MLNVKKASGEIVPFSEDRLRSSIKRAGVPEQIIENVVGHIKSKLYENIPTSEVYKHITEFLGKSEKPYTKTRYSLKQAIMDLGPTGFPFEDYVAEILNADGFTTGLRQTLQGKCINHEVDVIAEKNNEKSMIECKFHNAAGIKSQVQVSLYTKARFDDIKEKNSISSVFLATNTKLTQDALDYAMCSGMKVISWNYPENGSLRDLIQKYRLFPITTLSSISEKQKRILTENHIVLAKDICKNPSSLDVLNLPKNKTRTILSECQFIYPSS